jgi:hypothetical protein
VVERAGAEAGRWVVDDAELDLDVIAGLARLQLIARRVGLAVRLDGVGSDLGRFLELLGLSEALGALGQAEVGEEAGRVEKVVEGDDPAS